MSLEKRSCQQESVVVRVLHAEGGWIWRTPKLYVVRVTVQSLTVWREVVQDGLEVVCKDDFEQHTRPSQTVDKRVGAFCYQCLQDPFYFLMCGSEGCFFKGGVYKGSRICNEFVAIADRTVEVFEELV